MIEYRVVSERGSKDPTKGSEDFGIAFTDTSPALFIVADGYWGSGRDASSLAPHLFYRNFQDMIVSEQLSPQNCERLLQECVTKTNNELRKAVPNGYTTFTAALVDDDHAYLFTLGDSVAFGYRTAGGLELLTEPDTDVYTHLKKFRPDTDPFLSYCIIDDGKSGPKNFFGLPNTEFSPDTHPAPQIKKVTVIPRKELSYLLLCSDGLTSRVIPQELETLCKAVDSEELLPAIMNRWKEPEKMILYLLHELKDKEPIKKVLAQYRISSEGTSEEMYDAIRKLPEGFAALRDACLTYDTEQGIRKPVDDTYVMLIDLRPIERKSVLALSQELKEAYASLETARGKNKDLDERITQLDDKKSALHQEYQTLISQHETIKKKFDELTGQLTSHQTDSAALRETIKGKEALIKQYTVEIEEYRLGKTGFDDKIKELEGEKARALEDKATAKETLASKKLLIEENLENIQKYNLKILTLTQDRERLEKRVKELEDNSGYPPPNKSGCLTKLATAGVSTTLFLCIAIPAIVYSIHASNNYQANSVKTIPPCPQTPSTFSINTTLEDSPLIYSLFSICPSISRSETILDTVVETEGMLSLCITPDNKFASFDRENSRAYAFFPTENFPDYSMQVECVPNIVISRKDTGFLLYYADPLPTLKYDDPNRFVLNNNANAVTINDVLEDEVSALYHCDYSHLTAVNGIKTCTTESFTYAARTHIEREGDIFTNVPIDKNDEIIIATEMTTEQVK